MTVKLLDDILLAFIVIPTPAAKDLLIRADVHN
jgi:hypothetical protein